MLERRPTFLEPEYPFEWTGAYSLNVDRYELSRTDGPDSTMSLVAVADQYTEDAALREGNEWCVRRYAEAGDLITPGQGIPFGEHVTLLLDSPGRKSFFFWMNGFISIADGSRRFVFQDVHMLVNAQPDRPWEDLPRRNQLVFIGRSVDEERIRNGFEACLICVPADQNGRFGRVGLRRSATTPSPEAGPCAACTA